MTSLDWLLLAIFGVSALMGLLRGFVGIVATFAAWLLGGWSALALGGGMARLIADQPNPTPVQMLMGYGACFLGTSLLIALLALVARRTLVAMGMGGVDRWLGLAVGSLRGLLLASVIVLMLGFTPIPRQPLWQASLLVPLFKPGALWMSTLLPVWARQRLDLDGRRAPARNPLMLPPLPRLPA